MLQSSFHVGKKTFNIFFQIRRFLLTQCSFDQSFDHTIVYCLLTYVHLPICMENILLLHPLIARLSVETTAFVSFWSLCFFLDAFIRSLLFLLLSFSLVISLRHSLSPVATFYSLSSASPAIALPFIHLLRVPVALSPS